MRIFTLVALVGAGGAFVLSCRAVVGVGDLSFDNGFENGTGGAGGGGGGGVGLSGAGGDTFPTQCGDGKVDVALLESCDDGNNVDGDFCSADCRCGLPDTYPDPTAFATRDLMGTACYVFLGSNDMLVPEATARDMCQLGGADLISVSSPAEFAYVLEAVGGTEPIWIGGKRLTSEPTLWRWLNGDPWLIRPCDPMNASCDGSINLWAANQPDNLAGEDCIWAVPSQGAMEDVSCSGMAHVLCKGPFFSFD